MCENVCTVLFHCFPQTITTGYETRTPTFKSTFEISLSPNRTSKDTRCTVAPCCHKCAQKISRQGTISLLFRTDNIFKRMARYSDSFILCTIQQYFDHVRTLFQLISILTLINPGCVGFRVLHPHPPYLPINITG